MWCGDVVITGVKWQISRHTAGDITLVAVEDPLIRSFHLAAQHMSEHCPGLWGTKHYCRQSCIKRCLTRPRLSISYPHLESLLSPENLLKVLIEAWNTVACWSRHVVLLPITPHSVLPCLNGPGPPALLLVWYLPPSPPPHTIPFSKPLRKHHLLPLAISHTSPQYCRIDR